MTRASIVAVIMLQLLARIVSAEEALPTTNPAVQQPSASEILSAAEQAFVAKDFARAVTLARAIKAGPLLGRARYVEGYARYKRGDLLGASTAMQRAQSLSPTPQGAFLAGLIAFERGLWPEALSALRPLSEASQSRWAELAKQLMAKTHKRMEEAKAAATAARHDQVITQVRKHLEAKRLDQARRALTRAETISAGHVLNYYYRGYLAYLKGDWPEARRQLRNALTISPGDPWSSYMLALCLDDAVERRTLLRRVYASSKAPALRRAAKEAMKRPATARKHTLHLLLEVGAGVDTNPAYATGATLFDPSLLTPPPDGSLPLQPPSSPPPVQVVEGESTETAMALRARGRLAYQRIMGRHRGSLGLRFVENAYAFHDQDVDRTELGAWIDYGLGLGAFHLTASYSYTMHLFDHDWLMSDHAMALNSDIALSSWISLTPLAQLRLRSSHHADYAHLSGVDLYLALGLKGKLGRFTVQIAYSVLRGLFEPMKVTLISEPEAPDGMTTNYASDFSFFGHGPSTTLEVALPWRLHLEATAWLAWKDYDGADTFSLESSDVEIWRQERRDVQVATRAELRWNISEAFALALRYSAILNSSTLDSSMPVNRSYGQHQALALLRWRWDVL